MPRMSEAEKQKSHQRIVEAAARLIRENGIEATSVSDVMQAAGLTHGGFYRHFESKEALVTTAFNKAVDDVMSDFEKAQEETPKAARENYIDRYLSHDHVADYGNGCPLAALGVEIGRANSSLSDEGHLAIERVRHFLQSDPDSGQSYALLAMLIGTITLARQNEPERDAILNAGRAAISKLGRA